MRNKHQLIQGNDRPLPSHLEKEMYTEIIKLKKAINQIKQILEGCK